MDPSSLASSGRPRRAVIKPARFTNDLGSLTGADSTPGYETSSNEDADDDTTRGASKKRPVHHYAASVSAVGAATNITGVATKPRPLLLPSNCTSTNVYPYAIVNATSYATNSRPSVSVDAAAARDDFDTGPVPDELESSQHMSYGTSGSFGQMIPATRSVDRSGDRRARTPHIMNPTLRLILSEIPMRLEAVRQYHPTG